LVKAYPPLKLEEEQVCAREAQRGNTSARDRFVLSQLRTILRVAKLFRDTGIALDDLVQSGFVAVQRKLPEFDAHRGIPFRGFAKFAIYEEMRRLVAEVGYAVALPGKEAGNRISANRGSKRNLWAYPCGDGCAERLRSAGHAERCVRNAAPRWQVDVIEPVVASPEESVLEKQEERAREKALARALHWFPRREKEAVCSSFDCMHFLTPGRHDLLVGRRSRFVHLDLRKLGGSVADQGERYRVSPGRISQIRRSVLARLREGPEAVWLSSWLPDGVAPRFPRVWYWDDLRRGCLVASDYAEHISRLVLGPDVLIYACAAAGVDVASRQVRGATAFLRLHGVKMPYELSGLHQPELGVFVDLCSNRGFDRPALKALLQRCSEEPKQDGTVGWVVIESPAHLGLFRWDEERKWLQGQFKRLGWILLYLDPFGVRSTRYML
jgi:RNA polymerase sigma factor (sigma-70 family)